MRIAFAGDRDISVKVLKLIIESGVKPLSLFVSDKRIQTHAKELVKICTSLLNPNHIFAGSSFRKKKSTSMLQQLNLDYIICIHFPYIVPKEILSIPKYGVINLHPAYLPYNRGWHTPSWAILEDTPIGATLHFMNEGVDTGDIIHQKKIDISPGDTADSLYRKLKELEFQVFNDIWQTLLEGVPTRIPQEPRTGTVHNKSDLFQDKIQKIDLDRFVKAESLIRQFRALTTNDLSEAAYYDIGKNRYRVQVKITEEQLSQSRS